MKNIWQLLQMRKWKRGMAACVSVGAIAAAVFFGEAEGYFENKTETTEINTTGAEASATKEAAQETEVQVGVNEEEAKLLSSLYYAMKENDFSGAATILIENEKAFDTLMTNVLTGEKYYYLEEEGKDGDLEQKIDRVLSTSTFTGMVLTRYNTVFYGEFSQGKPHGKGAAIQSMVLDYPRYSFAEGTWENGKLNGDGSAGYHYHLNAPVNGFVRTEKRGKYRNNLLDGEFVYETESASGETLSWNMKAVNGVTVITQEWQHYPYRKEYMLGSVENPERAYVLTKDKVATVLWNNLIVWPE